MKSEKLITISVLSALTAIWIIALLFVFMLALSGCTRTQVRYVSVPVPASTSDNPCLTDINVRLHEWHFTVGSTQAEPTDCPEKFGICLEPLDQAALEQTLAALITRVRDDWTLCGPKGAP